ncbi:MAG: ATP-dependent DNA ligase [Thermoleophilia bacterium]|nr:ATP-dependent DNA ligase [Thermoleophilia bacterium]
MASGCALTLVRVSNAGKPLWRDGFTKGEAVAYYERVAPVLLPHLAGRPVTLRRFPDGVDGLNWYQFQWPRGHPDWLRSVVLGRFAYCLVGDVPSLLWAANLAAVELHPLLAPAERPDEPSFVVLDLDPGPPAGLAECRRAALAARDVLRKTGLQCFAKTSGSLGLHLYVPLAPGHRFAATKAFARTLVERLASELPELVVARTAVEGRRGRVLVDWVQNSRRRSTVAAYSLRAGPTPTVSTPVTWDEVEGGASLVFGPAEVLARVERVGDLFAPVLRDDQRLR